MMLLVPLTIPCLVLLWLLVSHPASYVYHGVILSSQMALGKHRHVLMGPKGLHHGCINLPKPMHPALSNHVSNCSLLLLQPWVLLSLLVILPMHSSCLLHQLGSVSCQSMMLFVLGTRSITTRTSIPPSTSSHLSTANKDIPRQVPCGRRG